MKSLYGMGGDVTAVYLPDEGITGNSPFMFQELNNEEIADHLYVWLMGKDALLLFQ